MLGQLSANLPRLSPRATPSKPCVAPQPLMLWYLSYTSKVFKRRYPNACAAVNRTRNAVASRRTRATFSANTACRAHWHSTSAKRPTVVQSSVPVLDLNLYPNVPVLNLDSRCSCLIVRASGGGAAAHLWIPQPRAVCCAAASSV
eukprot:SAG31_NODE_45_length_31062_cov_17.179957_10_plen_145_part_00